MKEEIKKLQEDILKEFDVVRAKISNDCEEPIKCCIGNNYSSRPLRDWLIKKIEQTYKQGYFVGREDLKQEIIADFDNKQ
jgi:hypothetical protein